MEIDYMSDADFEAIYAITLEAPDRIGVMMASTPTGRRGTFWKACTQMRFNNDDKLKPMNTKQLGYVYNTANYERKKSEGWKEFHFPSMANPEWSDRMERELKKQYSEIAYEHEVLAEFGTETVGVFNKDFIDEASSIYYPFMEHRRKDGPIAIGIDWDKLLTKLAKKFPLLSMSNMSPLGENPSIKLGEFTENSNE